MLYCTLTPLLTPPRLPAFPRNPSPPPRKTKQNSAELVSKEHAHRGLQQNPSYTVPSSAEVPSTCNVPGDWAHRLPEAEQGCLLLAPENEVNAVNRELETNFEL